MELRSAEQIELVHAVAPAVGLHDGQLSRSIDIYRVFARDFSGVRGILARREVTNETSASNTLSCCRI